MPKTASSPTKRAIVYIRLSSYRGETAPSTSPERQEEACRAYCLSKDWTVIDVVSDLDVSGSDKGKRLERPGLQKIRSRWNDCDVIIFAKLDRLARNLSDFMAIAAEAKLHDVALVSVQESLDLTTPAGRFVAQILSAFAEMESATIAGRVTDAMAALRTMGRYGGGNRCFGYKSVANPSGNGFVLILEQTEAAIVRDSARRVLEGEKLSKVTKSLNDDGIMTRRGNRWSLRTVRDLLTSDAIMGRISHKNVVLVNEETGLPLEVWPPILDSDTVSRLRLKLNPEKAPGIIRNRSARSRLLSGIVRCDDCGKPLYQRVKHGRSIYECSSRSNGFDCTGCSVSADRLEEYISSEFLNRYSRFEVMELVESGADEIELAEIERSIKITLSEMNNADDEAYEALSERGKILRARRTELAKAPRETVMRGTGRLYGEEWNDPDKRRFLLSANVASLTIRKGTPGRTGGIDPARVNLSWKRLLVSFDSEVNVNDMPRGDWEGRVAKKVKRDSSVPISGTFKKN